MIDYETYCRIRTLHCEHGLSEGQIANKLELDPKTVKKWITKERYEKVDRGRPNSKLDPYKERIRELIERFEYTGHIRCLDIIATSFLGYFLDIYP